MKTEDAPVSCVVITGSSCRPRFGQNFNRSTHKWVEHWTLKNTKISDFTDTWSMDGPGPGSNFKVLHSVPLVTNLPFFRFSDTWNLHHVFKTFPLGGQCENKAALMFEIILILTISLDLFAWQDVGDCNWRICHILCSNFTSFCVNHQNTNALYCDENVDTPGKDFLFILAIYCIALQ